MAPVLCLGFVKVIDTIHPEVSPIWLAESSPDCAVIVPLNSKSRKPVTRKLAPAEANVLPKEKSEHEQMMDQRPGSNESGWR